MTVQGAMTLQSAHVPSRARSLRGRSQRSKPVDRSGSITRRARPSSEVQLREESAPEPEKKQELIGDIFAGCATNLVSDLVCDAIDEVVVDHMVYDEDEIVVDDPVSDEDMLADSYDPSCDAMDIPSSTVTGYVDCVHISGEVSTFDDVYEDVYSVVSESSDEFEEMMEEAEELAYASMARKFAMKAVHKGCLQIVDTWSDEEEEAERSMQISGITQDPRTSDVGETNAEAIDMPEEALCDFGDALLDTEVDTSDHANHFMCEDFVENGSLAFDMVGSILGVAFDEAVMTWGQQMSNARNEEIELRTRVRKTLLGGLRSGDLVQALKFWAGKDRMETSRECVRKVATDDGSREQLHKAPLEVFSTSAINDASEQVVNCNAQVQRSPQTPTRTRRRIIGAIARAPAANEEKENAVAGSDTISSASSTRRQHKRHSKTIRKPKNHSLETFNMDVSGGEESTKMRGSSLTRKYDTLGAPIFSLYVADEWQSSPSDMPSSQYSTRFTRQQKTKDMEMFDLGKFACDRSMSKASARLRAASTSAMAMDLGQVGNAIASPFPAASEIFSADKVTTLSGATWGKASAPSFSVTRTTKLAGTGLLPTLHSKRTSAEALAHTMQMSKTATKWCVTGLHGSASAVF